MCIFIDLKRCPVINGEELVAQFIAEAGYLLPPTKVISRLLLREEQKHAITNEEVTKALECIEAVFIVEKNKGWPNGIPSICIDDFHYFGSSNDMDLRSKNIYSDSQFLKFMDWCLSMTDAKLCHVVFVTSFAFCHLELDTHSAFRRRREILQFGYASFNTVRQHFEEINKLLISNTLLPLSPAEMDLLAATCGGQMKDMDTITSCLFRGKTCSEIIDLLITDSLRQVEDALENTLIEGGRFKEDKEAEKGDKKTRSYEKFLRLWRMMEMFSTKDFVPRRDMIRNVFQEHVHELEQYESANLVAYLYKKVAPADEAHGQGVLTKKEIGYENEELLESEELSEKQEAVKTDLGPESSKQQIEKKLLVEPTEAVDPKPTAEPKIELKVVEKETKKQEKKEDVLVPNALQLLQSPELMVQPGTPRLHVAFQVLLKEPRMKQQKRWIELQLQKKKLESKQEKLGEERIALRQEKKEMIQETRALLEFRNEWLSSFGQEDFNQKKEAINEHSQMLFAKLAENSNDTNSIKAQLDACEAELKELDRLSSIQSSRVLKKLTDQKKAK